MAASNPITGIQALVNVDALADRRDRTVIWAHDSSAKLITGVVPDYGAEFAITINSSALQVTVGNGAAMLAGHDPATGGYPCVWLSGVFTLNARDATNPRVDLIIARVADSFYWTGGDNAAQVEILAGAPGATPVAPTVPVSEGSYLVLGQLTVPSSANGGAVTLSQATAYTQVPRARLAGQTQHDYIPTFAQTNNIALDSTYRHVTWSRSGYRVQGEGNLTTAVTHSGGGGRPRVTLPVPHGQPLDGGYSMLGTMQVILPSVTKAFFGALVAHSAIGATQAYFKNYTGFSICDGSEGNFDFPAGTQVHFLLDYRVA